MIESLICLVMVWEVLFVCDWEDRSDGLVWKLQTGGKVGLYHSG